MSEQTANLCTTDACESLRARLAKYEDAEGRPLGVVGSDRESIRRKFDAFVAWPGSDHSTVTTTTCLLFAEQIAALVRAEYATQPGGVVLYTCTGKGGEYEYLGLSDGAGMSKGEQRQVYRCTSTGRVFHRECMDFSARMDRLNSSPVSAGDDRKLSDIGNELHNLSCHVVHHNEGWANQLGALASELWYWPSNAGVVDERAAMHSKDDMP